MERAKFLYRKMNIPRKVGAAVVAAIGVVVYVYEMFVKAVSVGKGFGSIGIILCFLAVIEGMFFLSEYLLFKNATVMSGTIDSFRGIGNGKLMIVKTDEGLVECSYYRRRCRGVYIGSSVTVVKRSGVFYDGSYPVVFPC